MPDGTAIGLLLVLTYATYVPPTGGGGGPWLVLARRRFRR